MTGFELPEIKNLEFKDVWYSIWHFTSNLRIKYINLNKDADNKMEILNGKHSILILNLIIPSTCFCLNSFYYI